MPAAVDVQKELEMITKLQAVDLRLNELEEEKGDLPGIVRNLENEIEDKASFLEQTKEKLAEIGSNKRNIEGQNQLARIKQEKYKEQLYQVTTNREYDAITQEIDNVRVEIEENDALQLDLLEQDEVHTHQYEEIEKRLEELNVELEERKMELGEKEEESAQEELELNHERDKLAVRIKKPIIAHYDRIRVAKGVGAAELYAGACGSCFAVIPPQRQMEVRKMNDIILCESCGVIVLPENEEA